LRQAHVFSETTKKKGYAQATPEHGQRDCVPTRDFLSEADFPTSGPSLPPRFSRSPRLSLDKAPAFPNVLGLCIQECCRLWPYAATFPWCTPLPLRYLWKHLPLTSTTSLCTLAPNSSGLCDALLLSRIKESTLMQLAHVHHGRLQGTRPVAWLLPPRVWLRAPLDGCVSLVTCPYP
jgi:hypothetical protein